MEEMYDEIPPGQGQIVLRPRYNLPFPDQVHVDGVPTPHCHHRVVGGTSEGGSRGGEDRYVFRDSVHEVGSGSGSGGGSGSRAENDDAASSSGGPGNRRPSPVLVADPNWSVSSGWVVYATHPKVGKFVVNEGVVLVGDRYMVCGGIRQGFFADVMPEPVRAAVRRNASIPIPPDAVIFPQLDMLCLVVGRIAAEVAAIANAGFGEVNPPHEEPEPSPAAPVRNRARVPAANVPARKRRGRYYPPMRPTNRYAGRGRHKRLNGGTSRSSSI